MKAHCNWYWSQAPSHLIYFLELRWYNILFENFRILDVVSKIKHQLKICIKQVVLLLTSVWAKILFASYHGCWTLYGKVKIIFSSDKLSSSNKMRRLKDCLKLITPIWLMFYANPSDCDVFKLKFLLPKSLCPGRFPCYAHAKGTWLFAEALKKGACFLYISPQQQQHRRLRSIYTLKAPPRWRPKATLDLFRVSSWDFEPVGGRFLRRKGGTSK